MASVSQPSTWARAPLLNKFAVIVAAVSIPLILASCGFASDEPYSLAAARECVADKGFEVGTISKLGTADVFAGWWPAGSPVTERQSVRRHRPGHRRSGGGMAYVLESEREPSVHLHLAQGALCRRVALRAPTRRERGRHRLPEGVGEDTHYWVR